MQLQALFIFDILTILDEFQDYRIGGFQSNAMTILDYQNSTKILGIINWKSMSYVDM